MNHWVATTCTENEQWLTVLRILLLSTHNYAVSTFRPSSQGMHRTPLTAQQQHKS